MSQRDVIIRCTLEGLVSGISNLDRIHLSWCINVFNVGLPCAVTAHYMSLHSAIKMLHGRLSVLHALLCKVNSGIVVSHFLPAPHNM